jgi:hypothetical protein
MTPSNIATFAVGLMEPCQQRHCIYQQILVSASLPKNLPPTPSRNPLRHASQITTLSHTRGLQIRPIMQYQQTTSRQQCTNWACCIICARRCGFKRSRSMRLQRNKPSDGRKSVRKHILSRSTFQVTYLWFTFLMVTIESVGRTAEAYASKICQFVRQSLRVIRHERCLL